MSKPNVCGACGQPRSSYIMNNKPVCLKCDELLFDLEIECEEMEVRADAEKKGATPVLRKVAPTTVKK